MQDVIDDLARACDKYYGLCPPEFQGRAYIDVRAVFIATPLINVEHDFEALLTHKNNDVLHNVSLAECRVPSNFGELSNFKKSLAAFLLNLSRHKDDPVVSVAKNWRIVRKQPNLVRPEWKKPSCFLNPTLLL